jgi:hypothetical protein
VATIFGLTSYTILDADGNRQAVPFYYTFDGAVVTLAELLAYNSILGGRLDLIVDGKIESINMTLSQPVPGTYKADPVVDSNVQETGLITFQLLVPSSKSYGLDIPAFAASKFAQQEIILGDPDVEAFVSELQDPGLVVVQTNDVWSTGLGAVRKARKKFRKHRG